MYIDSPLVSEQNQFFLQSSKPDGGAGASEPSKTQRTGAGAGDGGLGGELFSKADCLIKYAQSSSINPNHGIAIFCLS